MIYEYEIYEYYINDVGYSYHNKRSDREKNSCRYMIE